MKVGITGLVTSREWSFAETLDKIKGFGYDAFEPIITDEGEITVDTPEADLKAMAALAEEKGVELVSTCPALGKFSMNILSDDEAIRAESVEMTRKLLKTSAGLGCDAMLHTMCFPLPPDLYYDVAFENGIKSMKELAPYCAEVGCRIAIEYVWNKFLNGPMEVRDFLDRIGSDQIGFYYDPGNMRIHSHSHHWIRICAKHIFKVHMKDFKHENWTTTSFPGLLEGEVDFDAVMVELRAMGFDGALVSEVSPADQPYEKTAEIIRQIAGLA